MCSVVHRGSTYWIGITRTFNGSVYLADQREANKRSYLLGFAYTVKICLQTKH